MKITEIKIIPSIIAKFRFPFDVSKAIAVVITRVTPSIFPPTIMTDPTSDNALPVAAKIIVINENTASQIRDIVNKIKTNTEIRIVSGGTTRKNSVANGLNEINQNCDFVAIHDGARPWINPLQIIKVLEQAEKFGAAASGRPVTDTIKKCDNNAIVTESISREELWAMETPQIFSRDIISKAYSEILNEGIDVTDEVSAVMHYGKPVKIVHNEWANPKVTFPEDLKIRPPSYYD